MEYTSSDGESITDHQHGEEIYTALSKSRRHLQELGTDSQKKNQSNYLLMLTIACDCVEESDRGVALIANSLLQDIGIVSSQDTSDIIERNKSRRARKKKKFYFQKDKVSAKIKGIYFDGRKDQTLTCKKHS
ncbi:unnamed protein product [Lepeophtheirus salmonis]|uniref:(salmon louse) hypothetical protein n=1 Tax=Lepeophtheirus salmonis TaxID=72036 RepID=A0A7R8D9D4_LEPSM|nr:unnamed protein product [Lepeophtheirus salmonis]CAF3044169.1 unnamed protein product [Lepeophtheirus salmonis]